MRALLAVACLGGVAVAGPSARQIPAVTAPSAKTATTVAAPAGRPGPAPRAAPAVRPAPPALPPVWIGIFDPKLPAHAPWNNTALTAVPHGGVVRVLTPAGGLAASGDVIVVHALLGKVATGKVDDGGSVALAEFAFDQRDGDDGVLVVPATARVTVVAPSKPDVAAIKETLRRSEALAGVRRALAGLEVAAIDLDGDGKADVAATYGCTAWFDGSCQSKGQFFLVRKPARWVIFD